MAKGKRERGADGKPLRTSWVQREDRGVVDDKRETLGLTPEKKDSSLAAPRQDLK